MRSQLLSTLFLVVALTACTCEAARFYGTKVRIPRVADAFVRTYVDLPNKYKAGDLPTSLGVEMSSAFINNLDKIKLTETFIPPLNFTLKAFEAWLDFPKQNAQPYKQVKFLYGATGHPPLNVYGTPHFDFHYTVNNASVWEGMFDDTNKTTGPCGGLSVANFYRVFEPIPAQCFPSKTHVQVGEAVYGHGSHLYPLIYAAEWNPPQIFNQTLIYGQWGGEIQFLEPMAAVAYLNSTALKRKGQFFKTVAPDSWKSAASYPQKYGYYWNKDTTSLFIEAQAFKKAKACVYNEKQGWAGWFPVNATIPGPPFCLVPTPKTWPTPKA